jgi:hypothetical protein
METLGKVFNLERGKVDAFLALRHLKMFIVYAGVLQVFTELGNKVTLKREQCRTAS